MVYLVSADQTKYIDDARATRTFFLVETRSKSIIREHLKHYNLASIDEKTIQVIKEIPRVKLNEVTVVEMGSVKPLTDLALDGI